MNAVIGRLDPRDGTEEVKTTDEDEYFPPPRQLRDMLAAVESFALAGFGGDPGERVTDSDRSLPASVVLSTLH